MVKEMLCVDGNHTARVYLNFLYIGFLSCQAYYEVST